MTERRDLDFLALIATSVVQNALEAAIVRFVAGGYFSTNGERLFARHPANTLPYIAMSALENESVLELVELIKENEKAVPFAAELMKNPVLRLHRDMIGHPYTYKWYKPDRQAFDDAGHKLSDVRSGLVWAIANAFDRALEAEVATRRIAVIPAHLGMGEVLRLILRLSARDERSIPPAAYLTQKLAEQTPDLIELLEKFPDGTRPPDDDD